MNRFRRILTIEGKETTSEDSVTYEIGVIKSDKLSIAFVFVMAKLR